MFRGSDFTHWASNETPRETTRPSSSLSAACSSSSLDQKLGRISRSYFRPDAADQLCEGAKRPPASSSFTSSGRKTKEYGEDPYRQVNQLKPVVEKTKKEIEFHPVVEIDFAPQHDRGNNNNNRQGGDITLPPLDVKCQKRRDSDEDIVTKPSQPKRWHRTLVDVMPDFQAPLIGVKESLEAYRTDRCAYTTCFECGTFLYFISTADLVLCPHCKAISPTDKHIPILVENSVVLGMGLTVDHVLSDPDGSEGHF